MYIKKPEWLKIKLETTDEYRKVKQLVEHNNLHTICSSGKCPNINDCWSKGTATLMILGDICTRSCKFCATKTGKPLPIDKHEPKKIANTVKILNLKHVVITSVDRDDLNDYGANHWAKVIREVRNINPETIIEVLVPDFQGKEDLLQLIIEAKPNIVGHNIETVERLTPLIRSKAQYDISLKVLQFFASKGMLTKSGFMVGLGETDDEVFQTIKDLKTVGCSILTIGQYLQPTKQNYPVQQYVELNKFEEYKNFALSIGFDVVESAPLVRSSYMAEKSFSTLKK